MGIFDLESREALIGTPTVTVNANATGNVLERLEYIRAALAGGSSNPVRQVMLALGLIPPSSEPVDRTISATMTFEDFPVHYYRNLTIDPGVTVKLRNGPMIIVVEGDLTIGEGAVIDGNGLGGKGGPTAYQTFGKGGYGGTTYNFAAQDASLLNDMSVPFNPERVLFGVANTELTSMGSVNGRAWEDQTIWPFPALVQAILSRTSYHPTYGGLGGGGGGSGAGIGNASSIIVPAAKYHASKGNDGDAGGEPGTGGLGFGGGGSGGASNTGQTGSGGAGGNGGGTQLWIVKRINNAGRIESNGTDGANAILYAGGGGGGGGGCASLIYWEAFGAGVGTWQADGGVGGSKGYGSTYDGGNGGAGMVKIVAFPSFMAAVQG